MIEDESRTTILCIPSFNGVSWFSILGSIDYSEGNLMNIIDFLDSEKIDRLLNERNILHEQLADVEQQIIEEYEAKK